MLVYFVREINGVVLDAQICDHLQFRFVEDFADGIVRRVNHDHASPRAELGGEFIGIQDPIGGRQRSVGVGPLSRAQRDEDRNSTGDSDERLVTIEEWLDDDHLE